jgi:hypothetical protein
LKARSVEVNWKVKRHRQGKRRKKSHIHLFSLIQEESLLESLPVSTLTETLFVLAFVESTSAPESADASAVSLTLVEVAVVVAVAVETIGDEEEAAESEVEVACSAVVFVVAAWVVSSSSLRGEW